MQIIQAVKDVQFNSMLPCSPYQYILIAVVGERVANQWLQYNLVLTLTNMINFCLPCCEIVYQV